MSVRRSTVQHIEIDGITLDRERGHDPVHLYVEEHGLAGQKANWLTISIMGETRGALTKIDQQGIDELHDWLGLFRGGGPTQPSHPFTAKARDDMITPYDNCQWVVSDNGPSYTICGLPRGAHRG